MSTTPEEKAHEIVTAWASRELSLTALITAALEEVERERDEQKAGRARAFDLAVYHQSRAETAELERDAARQTSVERKTAIERLEQELMLACGRAASAEVEIERIRAALKPIVDWDDNESESYTLIQLCRLVRATLERKEQT